MDRRDFLRGTAGAALAAGAGILLPGARARALGAETITSPRFRGSSDGRIYELGDDGETWQPRANFGAHCAIPDVFERGGKVYARVIVQGHVFTVRSPDGRKWYPLDRVSQGA